MAEENTKIFQFHRSTKRERAWSDQKKACSVWGGTASSASTVSPREQKIGGGHRLMIGAECKRKHTPWPTANHKTSPGSQSKRIQRGGNGKGAVSVRACSESAEYQKHRRAEDEGRDSAESADIGRVQRGTQRTVAKRNHSSFCRWQSR